MEGLPTAKAGWTSMTFSLINIELVKAMQRIAAHASSSLPSSPPSDGVRIQVVNETKARIEEYVKHCNPVIPQHRMTLHCSQFLLRKLDFVTRLQWLQLQHSESYEEFTTEENLVEALEILEPRLASEDDLMKQFSWAKKAYPQYHVTMYVLWHLCVKPEGLNVGRAWKAIESSYNGEQGDGCFCGFGPKSEVLVALRAKAISVREKMMNNRPEMASSFGGNGMDSRREESQPVAGSVPLIPFYDGLNIGNEDWLQWTSLFQDF